MGTIRTAIVVGFVSMTGGLLRADEPAPERASERAASARERPASADFQPILDRLQTQDQKLDELQQNLAALTKLVSGPNGPQWAIRQTRQGEPTFRPLYTIGRDGSDLQFLWAAPGMITTGTPQWSHDGRMVAVDSMPRTDTVQESRIWIYGVAGPFKGAYRYLGAGNTPSWSPDDSQIAYFVNPQNPDGARAGVWTMNADGSGRKWWGEGWYPRWSPNGQEICVHAHDTTPPSLRIFSVASGELRSVLGDDIEVLFGGATWSSDGKRLVTLIRRHGEQQLVTIDAQGDPASIKVIYREPNVSQNLVGPPVMSPDAKQIVFGIQDLNLPDSGERRWMNTHLYLVASHGLTAPDLLEGKKIGKINRSMEWSPDSRRIIFSSER
jgi:Tol biopolymer transport system component